MTTQSCLFERRMTQLEHNMSFGGRWQLNLVSLKGGRPNLNITCHLKGDDNPILSFEGRWQPNLNLTCHLKGDDNPTCLFERRTTQFELNMTYHKICSINVSSKYNINYANMTIWQGINQCNDSNLITSWIE